MSTGQIRAEGLADDGFDGFVRRAYPGVLALAMASAGSRQVAEELAQEAFIAAFRSWDMVAALDHPDAWVRRVVLNRSASRFRRLYAEARALAHVRSGRGNVAVADLPDDAPELWAHARALPRRQREVVLLTYLLDLSRADVAVGLGCSEETVKTHLTRARAALAVALGPREGRESNHGR